MSVIRTEGLSKSFRPGIGQPDVRALDSLTMTVEPQEIFGFLGPNGAGKTTTMKILMGLIYPTAGEASIFGLPVGDPAAKRRIGFLPEHPYFYDHLTGTEILDYFGRLFGIDRATIRTRSKALLERVDLTRAANLPLRSYSKGMLQRIGIAQALINDPELVVLDEPMSGLDPVGRKEIRDLILQLRAEKRTVFFSTHILSDVEVVCDRVAILSKGRVAALSPLHDLLNLAGGTFECVIAGPEEAIRTAVLAASPTAEVRVAGGRVFVRAPTASTPQVIGATQSAGGRILSMENARKSLEEIFLQLIAEPSR